MFFFGLTSVEIVTVLSTAPCNSMLSVELNFVFFFFLLTLSKDGTFLCKL